MLPGDRNASFMDSPTTPSMLTPPRFPLNQANLVLRGLIEPKGYRGGAREYLDS